MTKTGKRILAVSIVFFMALWIGYLGFTGNHMSSFTKDFAEYKSVVYEGKYGTMVAFTENGAMYDTAESTVIMLEVYGVFGRRNYYGKARRCLYVCGGRKGHAV